MSTFSTLVTLYRSVTNIVLHRNTESLHGIHCHLGSTISKLEPIRDCVTRLKFILKSIQSLINVPNPVINVGGGHGIDYHRYKGPRFKLRTPKDDLIPLKLIETIKRK